MNYEKENTLAVVETGGGELMDLNYDNVLVLAERADKMVQALNKIMQAAIKITTERDWVLIGGTPYLQESGATKVARLFGISWKILDNRCEYDGKGYPTYTYRMAFSMGGATIECEGSRSGSDEFFAGKDRKKGPDEIDARDVRLSAYTNCLNNGIKRILPGLRNLDISALEAGGLRAGQIRGYTFKEGSRGGTGKSAEASGLVCAACGKPITQKIASYSQSKYGRMLCMDCQKQQGNSAPAGGYDDIPPIPDEPYGG